MRQLSRFHIWLAIFNQFYFNIKQKNTLHVQQWTDSIQGNHTFINVFPKHILSNKKDDSFHL